MSVTIHPSDRHTDAVTAVRRMFAEGFAMGEIAAVTTGGAR